MIQAILYKEWLKTRMMLLLLILLAVTFTTYAILQIHKVITIRGAAHLWEILLMRDNVFIEVFQYLPLASGVLLSVAQFVPEMIQKRLKLTLHLPLATMRLSCTMLGYGAVSLFVLFFLQIFALFIYLRAVMAIELVLHILSTALPWFLAGIVAYGLTSWICLEPTWGRRATNTLIGVGVIRLFFIATSPEAYVPIMPFMILFTLILVFISLVSIRRFKAGVQ